MLRQQVHVSLAALIAATALLAAGCSPNPEPQKPTLREYKEGGSLELQVQGKAVAVPFETFSLLNTDEGAPDLIEITGTGTYLVGAFGSKLKEGPDGMTMYTPLLNKPVPIQPQAGEKELTIKLPGLGTYPVLAGNLTLQRFRHGMDGRDWWKGTIELTVRTAAGPTTLFGAFKGGIVPTW